MNEAALQRLVDESDLRDLMQALPRALDEKNFEALGALFTEDGVHEIAGQTRRGRQAIADGPKGDLGRLWRLARARHEMVFLQGEPMSFDLQVTPS